MNIICDMNEYRKAIKEFNVRSIHHPAYHHTHTQHIILRNDYIILLKAGVFHSQNPFLDELFESLQTLCNIFIVKPENLPQICSEEPYVRHNTVCAYV